MVRIYTKIGDVFSAKTDEKTKKYFQLIAYDLTQLIVMLLEYLRNDIQ